jgi:hypothetical protein
MRRRILLVPALVLACAVWAVTLAAGAGPSPGLSDNGQGVVSGGVRYVSHPSSYASSLEAVDRETGRVLRHMTLKGMWGIPLVAYDGTAEGLLPGHRLLLAPSLFSGQDMRKTTTFKVVDLRKMKVARTIRLKGAFSYDALSPDGRYLYLVEYVTPEDPSVYRVRAYDLRSSTLLAKIVTDKRSWETGMRGIPMARAWKADWAYTLYGANNRPFIHALNTRGVEAVCIFLPWQGTPQDMFHFRLRIDADGHLVVRGPKGRALVVIDTDSFQILSAVKNP